MTNDVVLATPEEVAAVRAKWLSAQPKRSSPNMSAEAREKMRKRMSKGVRRAWKRQGTEDEKWDRIFREKFADPNYYNGFGR